eukprot:Skav205798  [mRNA]  locus=scaffold307:94999:102395:- [translate_table: standard]
MKTHLHAGTGRTDTHAFSWTQTYHVCLRCAFLEAPHLRGAAQAELLRLEAAELAEHLSQYLKASLGLSQGPLVSVVSVDTPETGMKNLREGGILSMKSLHGTIAEDMVSIKKAWRGMALMQRKAMKFTGLSRFAKTRPDEEQGDTKAEEVLAMPAAEETAKVESFWFKFQLGVGCAMESDDEENFPVRFRCLLFIFIILSPEHCSLLLSFFLSLVWIVAGCLLRDPSQVVIASLIVSSCCLAFVLYDFLDIAPGQKIMGRDGGDLMMVALIGCPPWFIVDADSSVAFQATTARVEQRRLDLQAGAAMATAEDGHG